MTGMIKQQIHYYGELLKTILKDNLSVYQMDRPFRKIGSFVFFFYQKEMCFIWPVMKRHEKSTDHLAHLLSFLLHRLEGITVDKVVEKEKADKFLTDFLKLKWA